MKKIIVLISLIVLAFACTCSITFAIPVSNDIENTSVMDDLRSTSGWNIYDYPSSDILHSTLINFVEYGWDSSDYGLYIYVYNPSERPIMTNSSIMTIQMSVCGNQSTKYSLTYLSSPTEEEYQYRFYKFSIDTSSISSIVKSSSRTYSLSSIELKYIGNSNVESFTVAQEYVFTGSGDTLKCDSKNIEVIELDCYQTVYRPDVVSSAGKGHQNQLNSVWFSIPNIYLDQYGELYKVLCEWWEYKANNIIILNNQDVVNYLSSYIDVNSDEEGLINGCKYWLHGDVSSGSSSSGGLATSATWYNCAFNKKLEAGDSLNSSKVKENLAPLRYLMYSPESDVNDIYVSSSSLIDYMEDYSSNKQKNILEKYNGNLFSNAVDTGRVAGYNLRAISSDDTLNLKSYDSNHSWFDKLLDYGFFAPKTSEDFVDVVPIYCVKAEDLTGNNYSIAKRLYVDENDVDSLKSQYSLSQSKGEELYLFRYALTDYYSEELTVVENGVAGTVCSGIRASETVFLNFDIIELTFVNEGIYKTISVANTPSDGIGGITGPLESEFENWLDSVRDTLGKLFKPILIALAVVVGLILLIILAPVLKVLVKAVVIVISAPFKLLIKIANKEKEK